MKPIKIDNIFSKEELEVLTLTTDNCEKEFDAHLGRQRGKQLDTRNYPHSKLRHIANSMFDYPVRLSGITYVEYNKEFGVPNLPAHFDGDNSELIINFQLSANTVWQIGVELELFTLEDNSAVLFHPNESPHWRPHKTFKEGEYVKMIFFRYSAVPPKDYYHMTLSQDHIRFKEIVELRESLKENA